MTICQICGGECEKEVIHGGHFYWKCAACYTSQVLPQPPASEMQDYYDSFHLEEAEGGVYDEVEARMQADFPVKVAAVLKYRPAGSTRLLDVGCGKGFFVKTAMERGIDAEGLDVSHSGVEYATEKLGVKATRGSLDDMLEWRQIFDVATLWATIEHLPDPLSVLASIRRVLKPGGLLLCDTGLGHVFWERFLPGHSQWYDAPQHLFVFSEQGLKTLIEQAGFEIVHVDSNFDRTRIRRWIRWWRHVALCVGGGILLAPLLGRRGMQKMREEAKWPIGRLVTVVARNPSPR